MVNIDAVQTIAIIAVVVISVWQWLATRATLKVDNFSKIIGALNYIRRERLDWPDLERALFKSRKDWDDIKIKKRVYGVMLANLLEWTLFSRKSRLIRRKHWEDWITTWKEVILSDKSFAELMSDRTIYTFDFGAYELVQKLLKEIKKGKPLNNAMNSD